MNQNLLTLASKLILASTTGDETELKTVAEELAEELQRSGYKKEAAENPTTSQQNEITGFLKFTDKENNS